MGYKAEYEYDIEEFVADWNAYVVGSEGLPNTDYSPKKHFSEKYSDPKEAHYKLRRFAAAILYLQKHHLALRVSSHPSQRSGLVTVPLVVALWRYYGAVPDAHIQEDPEPSYILQLALEESNNNS